MKLDPSIARAAFVTALSLIAGLCQPGAASAQDDMKNMPGMEKPKPKKPAASATPKPAGAAASAPVMKDMPGMAPTAPAATTPAGTAAPASKPATESVPTADQKKMDAMPGMAPAGGSTAKPAGAASAKSEMDAMPGMSPAKPGTAASGKKDGMAAMPGMAGGAATPQRMSAPGVTILGPSQKWVPPRGRSEERRVGKEC